MFEQFYFTLAWITARGFHLEEGTPSVAAPIAPYSGFSAPKVGVAKARSLTSVFAPWSRSGPLRPASEPTCTRTLLSWVPRWGGAALGGVPESGFVRETERGSV